MDYNDFKNFWQSFAFTNLLRTFKMAISPSKMAISIMAVLLACTVGWIMDTSSQSVIIISSPKSINPVSLQQTELDVYLTSPETNFKSFLRLNNTAAKQGVFKTLWMFGLQRFNKISKNLLRLNLKNVMLDLHNCVRAVLWAVVYHPVYSIIFFTFMVLIITIAGGAICRCAALHYAEGANAGFTEAIMFSIKKLRGLIVAPAIPITFLLSCALIIVILGALGNVPVIGRFLLSAGIFPSLLIGLILSVALLGTIPASMMMYPVIAFEGSDGFDAISRSYAYVFIKPLSLGLYTLIAAIYGAFCHIFVRCFIFLLLITTYTLISFGLNTPSHPEKLAEFWSKPEFFSLVGTSEISTGNTPDSIAGFLINASLFVPLVFLAGFVLSFYFCACTIIYALMRRNVDSTPTNEVYTQLGKL